MKKGHKKLDKYYPKVVLKFSKILNNLKSKNNVTLCRSGPRISVNLKLNICFSINYFSIIFRLPPCTSRFDLSRANITYFISSPVAVDRRFNAASKKENKTEGMPIHFSHQIFP